MNEDLKTRCEKSFYSELYHFDDPSQTLVIDETTGRVMLQKRLDIYDVDVYRWLIQNHNPFIPQIYSYREENGKLIVLEEYVQGDTL